MEQVDEKWFKLQQRRAGVTAQEIAERMGRDRSIVSRILNGHQKMTLEWAQAFADVLDVSIEEVLERAEALPQRTGTRRHVTGFSENDAVVFSGSGGEAQKVEEVAALLGGGKPGVDVWVANNDLLVQEGILQGDYMLVDTHQTGRVKNGDIVVAQVYNANQGTASTLVRRYEAPVLVAATADRKQRGVHIVDHNNVLIRGKIVAVWRRSQQN